MRIKVNEQSANFSSETRECMLRETRPFFVEHLKAVDWCATCWPSTMYSLIKSRLNTIIYWIEGPPEAEPFAEWSPPAPAPRRRARGDARLDRFPASWPPRCRAKKWRTIAFLSATSTSCRRSAWSQRTASAGVLSEVVPTLPDLFRA